MDYKHLLKKQPGQSYYFLIFLLIGIFALSSVPFLVGAFSHASDQIIIGNMKKVQADLFFYKIDQGSFYHACIKGDVTTLQYIVLLESSNGLSCSTTSDYQNIALTTQLNNGDLYCVDSSGFYGKIPQYYSSGYCSK